MTWQQYIELSEVFDEYELSKIKDILGEPQL